MDESFELNGIGFIWDGKKARVNIDKHSIAFENAANVFFDPFLRIVESGLDGEARDTVVGMDKQWNLLFVVHVIFEHDWIRIISARKATRTERLFYEN